MLSTLTKFNIKTLPVLLMLVLALVLAACGDSPTSTPVPTATSTPPPTATVAPTTVPAATTVATTSGTGGTTAGATSGTSASGSASLPSISGTSEVTIDPTIISTVLKQFPGLNNPSVKFYTSDNPAQQLADTTDAALTGAGYTFSIPGSSKPTNQGGAFAGLYTKADAPDIVTAAIDIPSDPAQLANQLNIPGIDANTLKGLSSQLQGKKSVLLIIAAPGLIQALLSGLGSSGAVSSGATATPTK